MSNEPNEYLPWPYDAEVFLHLVLEVLFPHVSRLRLSVMWRSTTATRETKSWFLESWQATRYLVPVEDTP